MFAAASIVFIWAFTELGVPLMCDFQRVTSVQIFSGLKDLGRNPFVYALVVVVLVTHRRALRARAPAGGANGRPPRRRRQGRRARSARGGCGRCRRRWSPRSWPPSSASPRCPTSACCCWPLSRDWYGTVLPSGLTLDHVRAALAHDVVVPSIGNSLRYVTLSTAFDLVVGTTIAYLVTRTRSRAARVLDAAAMLPLAIPGLVMAFGYLAISREGRPLSFLNPLRDPTALLVIAYAMRRLPFVVRSAAAGLAADIDARSRRRRPAWAPARSRPSRASRCRCWRRT